MPSHTLARTIFLRLLGVLYLCAFLSLGMQVVGLIGHDGILPIERLLSALGPAYDAQGIHADRFRLVPTLCWIDPSDAFLVVQWVAGALLSVTVILGIAPLASLFLCWLLYLSLAVAGQIFMGYQWDNLLLETGFLAMLVAPLAPWPRQGQASPPSRLGLWLLRALLFKLMFSSGCVKLASHDPSWRNLTALAFHYQTQPLPTWLAWYANRCPMWLDKTACAVMFAIELGAPFLIILPRRPRLVGCALLISLQVLILLTGNYGFFNWLTIALCLLLLEDSDLRRLVPRRLSSHLTAWSAEPQGPPRAQPRWHARVVLVVAVLYLPVSFAQVVRSAGWAPSFLSPIERVEAWLDPLRTVSGYGLFAVMTTERLEIVIEGSDDEVDWRAYEFTYKPGPLGRRPRFVAPHQPRLDWQMWFAALGTYRQNRWFLHLCLRLLQGSRDVLGLFERNPFPDRPPRFVRARLYQYDFTEAAEKRADGAWWRRSPRGDYLPAVSLSDFGK